MLVAMSLDGRSVECLAMADSRRHEAAERQVGGRTAPTSSIRSLYGRYFRTRPILIRSASTRRSFGDETLARSARSATSELREQPREAPPLQQLVHLSTAR